MTCMKLVKWCLVSLCLLFWSEERDFVLSWLLNTLYINLIHMFSAQLSVQENSSSLSKAWLTLYLRHWCELYAAKSFSPLFLNTAQRKYNHVQTEIIKTDVHMLSSVTQDKYFFSLMCLPYNTFIKDHR